jgi:hypothetical protein
MDEDWESFQNALGPDWNPRPSQRETNAKILATTTRILFMMMIMIYHLDIWQEYKFNQYYKFYRQRNNINIWGTTYFDPNGSSSGAARLTHSTTEMQLTYSHLCTHGSKMLLSVYIQIYELDIDSNKNHTCD